MRRFLDDAAHQLRSPMAGIQASAEALLRGPEDPERDRLLANLVREAARGGKVVTSLLQLARVQQGQPLTRTPCDLLAVCADEADKTWSLAPRLDIVLRANQTPEAPLLMDQDAVRRIMANLLDNARRHADGEIQVLVELSTTEVLIRVTDDGPGLPARTADHAFAPFVSLDGMGGAGLGLPIARAFAQAHGGDLTYEDGGFVVRLPLEEVPGKRPD